MRVCLCECVPVVHVNACMKATTVLVFFKCTQVVDCLGKVGLREWVLQGECMRDNKGLKERLRVRQMHKVSANRSVLREGHLCIVC